MDGLCSRVFSTIVERELLLPGVTVCVALSGGPDSSALLLILNELKDTLGITVTACHFDHRFRSDSAKDEKTARRLASMAGVEMRAGMNENGKPSKSVQKIARKLRYRFFENLLDAGYADLVATGHTLDDSVETSIMWALRGAGPEAFGGGIRPIRGKYIRPLIETRKKDILKWLKVKGVDYATDPTNDTDEYLRNRVRRWIIPAMEKENPRAVEAIARLARLVHGQSEAFDEIISEKLEAVTKSRTQKKITLVREYVAPQSKVVRLSIYRAALGRLGMDVKNLAVTHVEAVDRLAVDRRMGKMVCLPNGFMALLDHGGLTFSKEPLVDLKPMGPIPFTAEMKIETGRGILLVRQAEPEERGAQIVDMDKLPSNIVFRSRMAGDFLRLRNTRGRKSLKKFLIDRKTPSGLRDSLPLLASGGEIKWAPGLFLSDDIAEDEQSQNRVILSFVWRG